VPPDSAVSFKAYISSRPGEVLTEKSTGCQYEGGWFQIVVANFPTEWKSGDVLKMEFSDKAHGTSCSVKHKLTPQDPELIKDVSLK
ncbi:MAG: hypothetical protein NT045_06515, partial [Candidatus Aureabacteria bacterium]|nr:hypothetical protein [Candidatus Auribacterota bacterium]